MKVSFTTKEYARLLELVHLGLWVAGSNPQDPASTPERYAPLAQKLFGMAEGFGCAELVETDVNGQLYPAPMLTEAAAGEKAERFIEELFWTELVSRLAERDLVSELGAAPEEELTDEQSERLDALEETYWREFEVNAVDNLVLLRGGKG